MSYDIYLMDPHTGKNLEIKNKHTISGGTYCVGGTERLWLNVTYNYVKHFKKVFGKKELELSMGKLLKKQFPYLRMRFQNSEMMWMMIIGNQPKEMPKMH